jgi:hypothetical protein
MNTYKAVSERAKILNGEDVFEADFSALEEKDHLDGGHLEIVPRTYRVLSNNFSAAKQGATFDGAFLVEQEAALIQGGHIERVDVPAKKKG